MKAARRRTGWVVAMGMVLMGMAGTTGSAGAAPVVPYTDPSVVGSIGLCNQAGQQITSGSIDTTPFAWRAVSTQAAPSPYNNSTRTAILSAYQPIQGLPPGDWSGDQLTASSRYTNPANPMAAATKGDDSLKDVVEDFPPKWNGFIQLRMYLGAADEQADTLHYPALDIQVTGDTWAAVGGATVNCNSGTAESIESIVLPKTSSSSNTSKAGGGSGGSATTSTTVGASSSSSSPGTSTPGTGTTGSGAKNGGADKNSALVQPESTTSHAVAIALIAVVVVLIAAAIFLFGRRRRLASHAHSPSSSSKGRSP